MSLVKKIKWRRENWVGLTPERGDFESVFDEILDIVESTERENQAKRDEEIERLRDLASKAIALNNLFIPRLNIGNSFLDAAALSAWNEFGIAVEKEERLGRAK